MTEFALQFSSIAPSSLPKIPFYLIEDLLESQTIETSEAIWKFVEGMTDKLTHPTIFLKGYLLSDLSFTMGKL